MTPRKVVGETIAFFGSTARHRSYPVIDEEGRLLGLVSRSDALRWQVESAPGDVALSDVVSDASQPFTTAQAPVGVVADLMVATGVGRVPIIDPITSKVIGILSRHDLLKARRIGNEAERTRGR
ncbi:MULTISPECIES: CBS domain-containing protein [Sphingobium]|uniref:CBS domain-containing protein n=2 Tax=Sphingomonadaceae TaxID=41297 RepID=UPI0017A87F81|nr:MULTISPECIES: CBS domain-containing protein [Sphingobium]MCW2362990.1 CBS domain-containing protein [Sphingobium sp. B10D3B]MCW2400330.1 CBS domain-containing protein [Sphingobium sp. B10D7B]MCW2407308.1 CBS domain-containing protein [Sphingobium xanthum]